MKKLTIEDKAKRYDEAIERAKGMHEEGMMPERIGYIFPELRENEDEKILRRIINIVDEYSAKHQIDNSDCIDWLEKQGEEKSDKIVEKAKTEKQRVLLTETDGTANIYWDCRSLDDVKILLSCGLEFIRTIEADKHILADSRFGGSSIRVPTRYDKGIKQGEQKSTDKVEPKFHAGDFITDGKRIFQIKETVWERNNRNDGTTYCESLIVNLKDGNTYANNTDLKEYHLWTIQDAKDGDVLSFNDGHGNDCIELIKSITDKKIEFWFCLTNGYYYEVFDGITPYTNLASRKDATPATKEQRDTIMKAMTDAGYTFDFEKKELKKIEQKPAWSEEDEWKFSDILALLRGGENYRYNTPELFAWLKSIKDRVQPQPKQEWSEEDGSHICQIIDWLSICKTYNPDLKSVCDISMQIDWLKSLKPKQNQYDKGYNDGYSAAKYPQWKPSEKQMEAFEHFVRSVGESGYASPYENNTKLLHSLLEQLKKLKG